MQGKIEKNLPSDSTLLSSCAFTCLFGDEPRMRTNSRAMFLRAGNDAHRFNFELFGFGCLLRFTSTWDADRWTLIVPCPSICSTASSPSSSSSEFDSSSWGRSAVSSPSDCDASDFSLNAGRDRLPYFLEPITNLGATSRVGEMLLDILPRRFDGETEREGRKWLNFRPC